MSYSYDRTKTAATWKFLAKLEKGGHRLLGHQGLIAEEALKLYSSGGSHSSSL